MRKLLFLISIVAAMGVSLATAQAKTYSFQAVSSNNPVDAALGEKYLRMDVTAFSTTAVDFKFYWSGDPPNQDNLGMSSFYFYDGLYLASPPSISSTGTVNLTIANNPGSLPDGTEVGLGGNAKSWVEANNTNQANAVQFGETATFRFTLLTGVGVNNVTAALDRWIELPQSQKQLVDWDGNPSYPDLMAVGIHLTGFDSGGSESYAVVPLPGAVLLLGAGMVRLVAYARRRQDS
jgi:hypothetical protein